MFKDLFKKTQYITVSSATSSSSATRNQVTTSRDNTIVNNENVASVPDGMWTKCPKCNLGIYKKELENNMKVCPDCRYHFRMSAMERVKLIADDGILLEEYDSELISKNPLGFPGYEGKIAEGTAKSGLNEGVVTGRCKIDGLETILCVMDSNFMMGSMGTVVGEKITAAIERATSLSLPIIIFTTSGGARMQEGMLSLMQMAKTSAALKRHSDKGLLYITILTDPTTGGVTASFAMLGDIIVAEKGALVGFAGKRVIEQTIKQKLPDTFQSAEFIVEHGFADMIADRRELKKTLGNLLSLHRSGENE